MCSFFKLRNGVQAEGERMRRWEEAFEVWLEERRSQFSPKVGRDSYQAWKEFLAFTQKAAWEVQVEEVEVYVGVLKDRGLRTGTINKRLAGLSKFYEHCQREGVDPECGAEFNPVSKARRPKLSEYEEAKTLSREAETALLEAIRQDPSPTGKRDYALFLTLLTTGRRAGEIRLLKWGALESEGERAWMRMGQGEKTQRVELPRAVWEAIRDTLEAAGRLAKTKRRSTFLHRGGSRWCARQGAEQKTGTASGRSRWTRCTTC